MKEETQMQLKFSDLIEKLKNDESFLDSQQARNALCRSLFFTLVEI